MPALPEDLRHTRWALREAGSGARSSFGLALPLDFGHRAYRLVRHGERRLSRPALAMVGMLGAPPGSAPLSRSRD